MNPLKSRKLIVVLAIVVLTLMLLPTQSVTTAAQPSGFRALNGAAARDFVVPGDMQLQRTDDLARYGLTAERYQQVANGADIFGAQLVVYRGADGVAQAVIGSHYPAAAGRSDVRIGAGDARNRVGDLIGRDGAWTTTLMLNPADGSYFYIVENRRADSRWFHWIDASSGAVINAYNGLAHGSGVGVQGDTKDLTGLTTQSGSSYRMVSADGRQTTYDARNRNRLPGNVATDSDDNWNLAGRTSPGQPALVDAHFFANVTDDYLMTIHGFDWLNYYSQGMVSSAHVQRNYNNAYWNGEQMAYGDGDGVTFIELSGDLDVVGHELTHGVTEATSNLIYQNESGALNEAFSDMMGTAIEFYYGSGNWTIGEDIDVGGNGFRNMANPGEDGDPSHYGERYTGTGDNGGVHINSGIANQWFYLLVNGGQNSDPAFASGTNVQGIGLAPAEEIAFLGFTGLPASADFCAARAGTIAVAGNNAANVADAWDEVGVDEALCGGSTGNGDGPVISNVDSAKLQGRSFEITWTTDVASDSTVTFTCCGSYSDSALVTSHRMTFNGSKNTLYEYYVTSSNADGTTIAGPFYHQN